MTEIRNRNYCMTCSKERKPVNLETVVDGLGKSWVQCKVRESNGQCDNDVLDCPSCHSELEQDEIDCMCLVCGWSGTLRDVYCGNTFGRDKGLV